MVDTSPLIKDEPDVFSTSRLGCMAKGDQIMNLITSSPNRFLSRIFKEKIQLRPYMVEEREFLGGNHCLVSRKIIPKFEKLFQFDLFFVGPRISANIFLTSIGWFKDIFEKLWLSERALMQYSLVFYYTLRSPKNKERIGNM